MDSGRCSHCHCLMDIALKVALTSDLCLEITDLCSYSLCHTCSRRVNEIVLLLGMNSISQFNCSECLGVKVSDVWV